MNDDPQAVAELRSRLEKAAAVAVASALQMDSIIDAGKVWHALSHDEKAQLLWMIACEGEWPEGFSISYDLSLVRPETLVRYNDDFDLAYLASNDFEGDAQ
ncbi:hypothetical protein LC612_40095 [Nostoc sp. CHAB 5834]|nr:hypothetical protein [Nostoc sp. CHAB 5834]